MTRPTFSSCHPGKRCAYPGPSRAVRLPPIHPSTPAFTGAGPVQDESASCGPCDALMLSEVEARARAPRSSGGSPRRPPGIRGVRKEVRASLLASSPTRSVWGPISERRGGSVMERCAHEAPAEDGPPDGCAIGDDDVMACGKIQPGACAWACSGQSQCDC